MGIKHFKPEEIISKQRQVEILCSQGKSESPWVYRRQFNLRKDTQNEEVIAIRTRSQTKGNRVGVRTLKRTQLAMGNHSLKNRLYT